MRLTILLMLVLLSGAALACEDIYNADENVVIEDVIESTGEGADCNISIYKNNTQLVNAQMQRHGLAYKYDAGVLSLGNYVSNIECNLTGAQFLGECNFQVGGGNTMSYVAIAIVIVGFIFLLFKVGDNLQFMYKGLNITKHLIALVAMWLLLPLVNVAIKASEEQGYGITDTLIAVYSAAIWVMVFMTTAYVLGLLIFSLYKLAGERV